MRGLNIYKTKDGFTVAECHYTADPDKDPERNGKEWLKEALKGVPGGKTSPAWRKEMEIDFSAYSGQLLCYHLINLYRHKIIVDKYIPTFWLKFGSLDWGRNNPASFHVYAVNEEKHIHSAYEIYLNNISIPDFAILMKKCPYFNELPPITSDPSMFNNNQEEKEGVESIADKFKREGINLIPAPSRDDEIAINELLDRWDKLDTREPTYTISPRCPKQIWELERLRYRELTTAMIEKSNQHEVLIDKDNHGWDDFKYFIGKFLNPAELKQEEVINPNSAWGRYLLKQRQGEEFVYG